MCVRVFACACVRAPKGSTVRVRVLVCVLVRDDESDPGAIWPCHDLVRCNPRESSINFKPRTRSMQFVRVCLRRGCVMIVYVSLGSTLIARERVFGSC